MFGACRSYFWENLISNSIQKWFVFRKQQQTNKIEKQNKECCRAKSGMVLSCAFRLLVDPYIKCYRYIDHEPYEG